MTDQINRLAGLASDGQERAPKYNPLVLKFNGNTGGFSTYNIETKEETPITDKVQLTVLRRRKGLSAWTSDENWFTNEFNNTSQKVCLYKNMGGSIVHEDTDIPANLRTKYPQLKTKEIVYVLFNGAVHKIDIKGASVREWWDFSKVLNEDGKHSFQSVIELTSEKVVEKGKIPYYKMKYAVVGESVLDDIEAPMKEVAEGVAKVDEYFSRKIAAEFQAGQAGQTTAKGSSAAPGADRVEDKEYPEESINIDDIPF